MKSAWSKYVRSRWIRPLRKELISMVLSTMGLLVAGIVPVAETSGPVWVAL